PLSLAMIVRLTASAPSSQCSSPGRSVKAISQASLCGGSGGEPSNRVMSARDWINAIWRQAASLREPGVQKTLSDFGYPFDLISAASADDALASARTVGRDNGFVPVIIVPGGWDRKRIAPSKRVRRAREMLQEAECDAAYGRQFLTDGLD